MDPPRGHLDAAGVAHVLAKVARKVGGVNLVLVGRQAGDIERGAVGPMLAEEVGMPCSAIVSRVAPAGDGKVKLRREALEGPRRPGRSKRPWGSSSPTTTGTCRGWPR